MAKFDADTLRQLRDVREVTIRTEKHPDGAVAIWWWWPTTRPSCARCAAARGVGTGTSRRAAPPHWTSPAAG